MRLSPNELVALLVATSFAAGLNVYVTIATLGLIAHFGLVSLPASLHLLDNWWIIVASAVMFVIEFFADKVPAFDLIWNALHTFIRVPIAAVLAYAATSQLSPEKQLLAAVLGGLIALAAHGGKTAVRAAVTPSPEPFSNISLSFGEDALAIFYFNRCTSSGGAGPEFLRFLIGRNSNHLDVLRQQFVKCRRDDTMLGNHIEPEQHGGELGG